MYKRLTIHVIRLHCKEIKCKFTFISILICSSCLDSKNYCNFNRPDNDTLKKNKCYIEFTYYCMYSNSIAFYVN